jgi:hypothetical protein
MSCRERECCHSGTAVLNRNCCKCCHCCSDYRWRWLLSLLQWPHRWRCLLSLLQWPHRWRWLLSLLQWPHRWRWQCSHCCSEGDRHYMCLKMMLLGAHIMYFQNERTVPADAPVNYWALWNWQGFVICFWALRFYHSCQEKEKHFSENAVCVCDCTRPVSLLTAV